MRYLKKNFNQRVFTDMDIVPRELVAATMVAVADSKWAIAVDSDHDTDNSVVGQTYFYCFFGTLRSFFCRCGFKNYKWQFLFDHSLPNACFANEE